jgi:hypothetical protein
MLYRFLIALFAFSLVGGINGRALASPPACQGGYSPQFVISGEVQNSTNYDEESLGALPHSIENVTFLTKTGPQSGSFQGVLLWDLLNKAGIKTDPNRDGQVLVADGENGNPLGSDTGFARLIVPGDKFGGRDAFWITSIKVLSGPRPDKSE